MCIVAYRNLDYLSQYMVLLQILRDRLAWPHFHKYELLYHLQVRSILSILKLLYYTGQSEPFGNSAKCCYALEVWSRRGEGCSADRGCSTGCFKQGISHWWHTLNWMCKHPNPLFCSLTWLSVRFLDRLTSDVRGRGGGCGWGIMLSETTETVSLQINASLC